MRRALSASVLAGLVALVVAAGSRDARACGGGGYMGGLEGLAVIAGATVVVVGGADATFATYDVVHASPAHAPSTSWAKTESYVTVPQSIIGLVVLAEIDKESFPIAFAVSSIPFMLSTHGIYAAAASPYGDKWPIAAGFAGAIDATMAAFDFAAMGRGEPMKDEYALVEMITGIPQIAFGVVNAADAPKGKAALPLAFSALPAFLTVHGFLTLTIHSNDDGATPAQPSSASLRIRPYAFPTAGGSMLGLAAVF